jgi:hypothetical protein
MKKIPLIIVSTLLVFIGCSGESNVIATYKGGKITREEFRRWKLLTRQKGRIEQKALIERMGVERIAVIEAKKEGFDKTDGFEFPAGRKFDSVLHGIMREKVVGKASEIELNEPIARTQHVYLQVRDFRYENGERVNLTPSEMRAGYEEALKRAKEIIARIESGLDFDAAVKKYSNEYRRNRGGDLGYQLYHMLPESYAKAAFQLEVGEYSREPVKIFNDLNRKAQKRQHRLGRFMAIEVPIDTFIPNGYYIIKTVDKRRVNEKSLSDVVKHDGNLRHIRGYLSRRKWRGFLDNLQKARDVNLHIENAVSEDKDDIVFRVGSETFTVAQLQKHVEYESKMGSTAAKSDRNGIAIDRKKTAERLFGTALLKRDALRRNIKEERIYDVRFRIPYELFLARRYMDSIGNRNVTLKESEIEIEYEENKEKHYYRVKRREGRAEKTLLSLGEARDRVVQRLTREKRKQRFDEWKEDVLKRYEFEIDL